MKDLLLIIICLVSVVIGDVLITANLEDDNDDDLD